MSRKKKKIYRKEKKFNKKNKNKQIKKEKVLLNGKELVVGTFQKSRNFGFVVPDDKKIETDIFVSKNKCLKAKDNQKVVVRITKAPEKNRKAEGEIVEILGNVDEAGVDMLSIIKEFDLPYEFPKKVLKELEYINEKVDKKDIPNREDFRDIDIFTIDGEDAKDLDDAISIEKTKKGTYILGVHIADVSYYVKEGSELDKEACYRGTSVYMLDRVIPMLPKKLSNGICSLNEGVDRFTLSIIMEIDSNGVVINSKITKGIINVTRRMSYNQVKKIIEGKDKKILKEYEQYIEKFKLMEELALILMQRRKKNGSLDLDLPEAKIILDENGKVLDIKKHEINIANNIIEQFMITANEEIAETFFNLKAPFIYRVHEEPDLEKVEELNKFLFDFGYKIEIERENINPKQFSEILEDVKEKKENKIISYLVLRTLKIARYESENKGHFGIASKYYCHFTSPIRRYPDLFIHRIISKYLENNMKIETNQRNKYSNQAKEYAETSSTRERIAQQAEREAESMKMAEFMEDRIGKVYEGIISSVTSFGVFVELPNLVEGLIRFENLGNDFYIYDEEHKILIGEKNKEIFKIGDSIKVQVIEASKILRRVSFKKYGNE